MNETGLCAQKPKGDNIETNIGWSVRDGCGGVRRCYTGPICARLYYAATAWRPLDVRIYAVQNKYVLFKL